MDDDNAKFIKDVCDQVGFKAAHQMIEEELYDHLDERIHDLISEGYEEDEAVNIALASMGDPVELGHYFNRIHRPQMEWTVLSAILILSLFGGGSLFIFHTLPFGNGSLFGFRQVIYTVVGWILVRQVVSWDYRKLRIYGRKMLMTSLVITGMTLIFGRIHDGSYYLQIGFLTFSTGAFSSLLFLVGIISELDRRRGEGYRGLLIISGLCLVSQLTLLLQQSTSLLYMMTIVYISLLIVALKKGHFSLNRDKRYLAISFGIFFILILFILLHIAPREYPLFQSYQTNAKWLGISGVLATHGWTYLPDNWPDYIYSMINTNLGTCIGLMVATIFLFSLSRMFYLSSRVKTCLGFYLALGCSLYIGVHFMFHILNGLGLITTINVGLPFVSFGTTDYMIHLLVLGLFLSIWRHNPIVDSDMIQPKVMRTKIKS